MTMTDIVRRKRHPAFNWRAEDALEVRFDRVVTLPDQSRQTSVRDFLLSRKAGQWRIVEETVA